MNDEYRKPKAPPAIGHAALAMEEGFYLEAASLYESMIEYLLLNYYNVVRDSKVRFSSLGALVSKLRSSLSDHPLNESEQLLFDLLFDLELWSKSLMAVRYEIAEAEDEKHWRKMLKIQKKQAKQARKFYRKVSAALQRVEKEDNFTDGNAASRKISVSKI